MSHPNCCTGGGGSGCPIASHVRLTHDSSGVPLVMCSSELQRSRLIRPAPSFLPNVATVCNRLTLSAALRSPPMARASCTSLSVGSFFPRSGSVHIICSEKLNRQRFWTAVGSESSSGRLTLADALAGVVVVSSGIEPACQAGTEVRMEIRSSASRYRRNNIGW